MPPEPVPASFSKQSLTSKTFKGVPRWMICLIPLCILSIICNFGRDLVGIILVGIILVGIILVRLVQLYWKKLVRIGGVSLGVILLVASPIVLAVILLNLEVDPHILRRAWRQITNTLPVANPVEELKIIVALHSKNTSWGKDYAYDVRKTESLVSPYQGIATYNNPLGYYYEVSFAYQEHRWVAKSWRVKLKTDSGETEWYDGVDYLKKHRESDVGEINGWNNAIAEYYRPQDAE